MAAALQSFFFVLWLVSVSFYIISAYCLRSFLKVRGKVPPLPPGATRPPMSVLKPIRGADMDTYQDLESFVLQDYPSYQVVFGVADPDDPAADVVRRLIADHPGKDLLLVSGAAAKTPNRKVGNLARIYKDAKFDILVVADSDMRVGPGYLDELSRHFEDPLVGLVTCPYRGAYPEDIGAAFEALTINTDFLPSVAVAERLEGISFALGATMAVRRGALKDIGGFEALADYLADDYQLGSKVKAAGHGLRLSTYLVDSVNRRESLAGYFSHQLRWGRTYRVCRPRGYFFSVLTKGTAFSLLFLAASGFSPAGWGVVAANLAMRYAQSLYTELLLVKGPGVLRHIWLLPFRDLAGFAVWFMSFTGSVVSWKGERFRVDREGRMIRLE